MIHFIQIDSAGNILRCGNAPFKSLREMPGADASYRRIPGPLGDPGAYYWSGGLVEKPPRPSQFHRFDPQERAWKLDDGLAWSAVRGQRDARLAACDWVTLRAQETSEPVPAPWMTYRQALRDITDQPDPLAIVWPTAPA
ncbi:tail fiber assembly protein [Delftia tsuruhatensis]|uniref:tail fiber assembly protein n=1 Tax=Delftia tsuruhatensis TaxID=180282 RepID=UPI0012A91417|nr:tail fiber assembly protein [Delftia tsuruhatensis]QFS66497.1 hypothetical protein GCS91_20370 [Delftia tsuruhatensis]